MGEDEEIDMKLLADDINIKDEFVEEEIEEEISSVEYGNFVRDVSFEKEEMVSASGIRHPAHHPSL